MRTESKRMCAMMVDMESCYFTADFFRQSVAALNAVENGGLNGKGALFAAIVP
jgi:hypothetical protein